MLRAIEIGHVLSHNASRHSVICAMKVTGQTLSLNVAVPMAYADALRASQKPLPGVGSAGLIAFPEGNLLNAVWLCTIPANLMDAVHTNDDALDPYIDYDAHFSGHWDLLDGAGNVAIQFADGSSIVMGATAELPTTYRHTVDANQVRQRVPFTRDERIPAPPPPFVFQYTGADGVVITKDITGNIVIKASSILLDTPVVTTTGNVTGGTGATGTFTTPTGQTVSVLNGLVDNIF